MKKSIIRFSNKTKAHTQQQYMGMSVVFFSPISSLINNHFIGQSFISSSWEETSLLIPSNAELHKLCAKISSKILKKPWKFTLYINGEPTLTELIIKEPEEYNEILLRPPIQLQKGSLICLHCLGETDNTQCSITLQLIFI